MNSRFAGAFLAHLLLAVGALVMMYPLLYGLFASFNTQPDFIRSNGILPIPPQITLENYAVVFHPKVLALIGGSLWVTGLRMAWYTLFNGLTAMLLGYVFARLRFRGKETVFWVLLSSMLVPGVVFQIPLFVMMARMPLAGGNDLFGQGGSGFIGQLPALLLPGIISVYSVFLLRQTYYSIPVDYEEAARIEGANFVQILAFVYWPMLKPVMAVVAIGTIIGNWNDYIWPLMVISGNRDLWPTAMMFQRLMAGGLPADVSKSIMTGTMTTITNTPLVLTFGVIATIPSVLFFFFFQRYFIEGMQGAGLKG
jgi:multiple sugar transport system permease protein